MENTEPKITTKRREDGNFDVTLSTGREIVLRQLPNHFFLLHGEIPVGLANKAVAAIKKSRTFNDAESELQEVEERLRQFEADPEKALQRLLFQREAVQFGCVSPKITLTGEGENEIRALDLQEIEFIEIRDLLLNGGLTEGLDRFLQRPRQTARHRTDGAELW